MFPPTSPSWELAAVHYSVHGFHCSRYHIMLLSTCLWWQASSDTDRIARPSNFFTSLLILFPLNVSLHIMSSAGLMFPHLEDVPTFGSSPLCFSYTCTISTMIFLNNWTWTVTSKGNSPPCTQRHHYISGLTFIPFLHTDTVYRLALCNHLAEHRGTERPMLSKCLFPVITVNKAPIWPVLHCTYVMKHSVSPDIWHLTKLSVFLTAVNSELSSSRRPTSSDS